jgi:hypothetical protein
MDQVGFEDVQAPAKLFDLVLDFPLYLRGLACFVADMNIHRRLGSGEGPQRKGPQALFKEIVHLLFETRSRFRALHSKLRVLKLLYSRLIIEAT